MIYFDNAATTYPKSEEFYCAIDNANRNHAFNVGRGSYKVARECFDVMEKVRAELASYAFCSPDRVCFSSSATESLNQIIYGAGFAKGDNVYVSPFEHNAIMRPLHLLKKKIGIKIHVLPFDTDTWEFEEAKCKNVFALNPPKAVFLSQISNVTGYCLPYDNIFRLSKNYGDSINVLDASQAYAILPVGGLKSIDFIVFAGHKSLYAGFGIAGFINSGNKTLNVVKAGGTGADSLNLDMPENGNSRYEAGSPNIVAIYGLDSALKWQKTVKIRQHEEELTEYFLERVKNIDNVVLFHPENIHPFGIVSFAVAGYTSSDVGTILVDEFDICVRTGYHCAPLVHNFINSDNFRGTIRVSFGFFNSKDEIDCMIRALQSL